MTQTDELSPAATPHALPTQGGTYVIEGGSLQRTDLPAPQPALPAFLSPRTAPLAVKPVVKEA